MDEREKTTKYDDDDDVNINSIFSSIDFIFIHLSASAFQLHQSSTITMTTGGLQYQKFANKILESVLHFMD